MTIRAFYEDRFVRNGVNALVAAAQLYDCQRRVSSLWAAMDRDIADFSPEQLAAIYEAISRLVPVSWLSEAPATLTLDMEAPSAAPPLKNAQLI